MAKEQSAMGVSKKVLQDLLGLDPKTTENVIRIIKNGGHLPELKTQIMRRRIGTRAMALLGKTLEIANEELAKNKKPEAKDDKAPEKKEEPKKEVKESFMKYLLSELAGSEVDYTGTDDEQLTAQQKAQKAKQMRDNPEKKRLDKQTRMADTTQELIAAENKRHQLALQKIKDRAAAGE